MLKSVVVAIVGYGETESDCANDRQQFIYVTITITTTSARCRHYLSTVMHCQLLNWIFAADSFTFVITNFFLHYRSRLSFVIIFVIFIFLLSVCVEFKIDSTTLRN